MTTQPTSTDPSAAHRALVDTWVVFTKALAIYPDTNQRVQATLADWSAAIGAAARGSSVEVLFFQDHILVDELEQPLDDSSNSAWLKERLDRVGLAGARFTAPADAAGLLSFSRTLLDASARGGAAAAAAADPALFAVHPGLEPIERRYVANLLAERGSGGESDGGTRRNARMRADAVTRRLEESDEIRARLERLQQALLGAQDQPQPSAAVELLARLVRLMPAEVLADPGALGARVEQILDGMIASVESCDDVQRLPDAALSQLMFSVGRKLFYRDADPATPAAEMVAPSGPRGHAGDDLIEEDLDTLIWEMAALPVVTDPSGLLDELEFDDEQLLVYLYFLVQSNDIGQQRKLYGQLHNLLAEPTPRALEVLRAFFTGQLDFVVDDGMTRLLVFLREVGLMPLLRRIGVITEDRVIDSFPTGFTLFLDSLDAEDGGDHALLARVVGEIGAVRIEAAAEAIAADGGLGIHNRDSKVLAAAQPATMPLVGMLLEQVPRRAADVAVLLRAMQLSEREATPLRLLPADQLPAEYVACLAAKVGGAPFPARIKRMVSLLLVRFLQSTMGQPEEAERRLVAIQHLRQFPSRESAELLEEIVRGKKLLTFKREPLALRQAAAAVLEAQPRS